MVVPPLSKFQQDSKYKIFQEDDNTVVERYDAGVKYKYSGRQHYGLVTERYVYDSSGRLVSGYQKSLLDNDVPYSKKLYGRTEGGKIEEKTYQARGSTVKLLEREVYEPQSMQRTSYIASGNRTALQRQNIGEVQPQTIQEQQREKAIEKVGHITRVERTGDEITYVGKSGKYTFPKSKMSYTGVDRPGGLRSQEAPRQSESRLPILERTSKETQRDIIIGLGKKTGYDVSISQEGYTFSKPIMQSPVIRHEPRQEPLSSFENRIYKLQEREKRFYESSGFKRIQQVSAIMTQPKSWFTKVYTPYESRGFIGKTAQLGLQSVIGGSFYLGGLIPIAFEKAFLTGEAYGRGYGKTTSNELLRSLKETSKIYDIRTPEGVVTWTFALGGGLVETYGNMQTTRPTPQKSQWTRTDSWLKVARQESIGQTQKVYSQTGWATPSRFTKPIILEQAFEIGALTGKKGNIALIRQQEKIAFGEDKFTVESIGIKTAKPLTRGAFKINVDFTSQIIRPGTTKFLKGFGEGLLVGTEKGFKGFEILDVGRKKAIVSYRGMRIIEQEGLSTTITKLDSAFGKDISKVLYQRPSSKGYIIEKELYSLPSFNEGMFTKSIAKGISKYDAIFPTTNRDYYIQPYEQFKMQFKVDRLPQAGTMRLMSEQTQSYLQKIYSTEKTTRLWKGLKQPSTITSQRQISKVYPTVMQTQYTSPFYIVSQKNKTLQDIFQIQSNKLISSIYSKNLQSTYPSSKLNYQQLLGTNQIQKTLQKQLQQQRTLQKQMFKQTYNPRTPTMPTPFFPSFPSYPPPDFPTPTRTPPKIMPPIKPPFEIDFSIYSFRKKKKKSKPFTRALKYQPSLVPVAKGIKGKKPKILTGLKIRPLVM